MTITSKPGTVQNWNRVFGRSRSVVLEHLDNEYDTDWYAERDRALREVVTQELRPPGKRKKARRSK
jgi:hypothetical protein